MGCNTKVYLPPSTRLKDAVEVMGMLAGLQGEKRYFGDQGFWSVQVPGVTTYNTHTHSMVGVTIQAASGTLVDGELRHDCNWFYEADRSDDRLVYGGNSTPFWMAIGRGLVDFFGGRVDDNDCDSSDCDYWQPRVYLYAPDDGKEWERFQLKKLDVRPIRLDNLVEA